MTGSEYYPPQTDHARIGAARTTLKSQEPTNHPQLRRLCQHQHLGPGRPTEGAIYLWLEPKFLHSTLRAWGRAYNRRCGRPDGLVDAELNVKLYVTFVGVTHPEIDF